MLLRRANLEGHIDRRVLMEVIGERLGKVPESERDKCVQELKDAGVIVSSNKCGWIISRTI